LTFPAPEEEILALPEIPTPAGFVPVINDMLPLIEISPMLVLTVVFDMTVPIAPDVPHAELPVIVTLPEPVDEMVALLRATPQDEASVPYDVPLIVRVPVLVVTVPLIILIPDKELVPQAAVPVIVTFPELVDETLAEFLR
jgi:hypothetical protein